MSELHLSLIVIGLVIIGFVLAFNRWQEYRFRKKTEELFARDRPDVLLDEAQVRPAAERVEPTFSGGPIMVGREHEPALSSEAPAAAVTPFADWSEPQAEAAVVAVESKRVVARASGAINETIDSVALIRPQEPLPAAALVPLIERTRSFGKPVNWEGLAGGQWGAISAGAHYEEIRLGLQLADRRGPAMNGEISGFLEFARGLAGELGGSVEVEDEQTIARRAAELDRFCADVDQEIGVNLAARNGSRLAGTKVRALAEASGMKLASDGVFRLIDERDATLFTLRNAEPRPFVAEHVRNISTRGLTFLLDVPRTPQGMQSFDRMLDVARHLAHTLNGELVDDENRPITANGTDAIRRHLKQVQKQMESFGVPAGSSPALRLFS